jgi:hypothetical protein
VDPDTGGNDDGTGERPVFVVGMRRSGTTLMRSIIGAHPSIAMPRNESNYPSLAVGMSLDGDVEDFDRVWAEVAETRFAQNLRIDLETTRARLRQPGVDHRAVFSGLLREYARNEGKSRWGDKTPGNELHLPTLWQWFPDAQVIYLLRDPRAVIASLLTAPWRRADLRRLVDGFAERWQQTARLATAAAADGRALVVRYEDLVRSPESEATRICGFLGEPFAPEMLEARNGGAAPEGRKHNRPPDTASVARWRSVLSRRETAVIEHITRREMLEHGYSPDTSSAGPVLAAQVALMRAARRTIRLARRAAR